MPEMKIDLASWLDDMTSVDVSENQNAGGPATDNKDSANVASGDKADNAGIQAPDKQDEAGTSEEGNSVQEQSQTTTESTSGEQDSNQSNANKQENFYNDDELARLLETEPGIIDFDKVPPNVRSVVKVMANKAIGEQQRTSLDAEYNQVKQQAENLKAEAHARALQEIEQRFGIYDPTDPQQVTLLTRAVSEGERLATNLVRAFEVVNTLKAQEPKFDKIIAEVERIAKTTPMYQRAWDEADVDVLKPLYDQVRQRFYTGGGSSINNAAGNSNNSNTQVKEGLHNIQEPPPNVEKPGTGQPKKAPKFVAQDFAFLDESEQAKALIELGLVD